MKQLPKRRKSQHDPRSKQLALDQFLAKKIKLQSNNNSTTMMSNPDDSTDLEAPQLPPKDPTKSNKETRQMAPAVREIASKPIVKRQKGQQSIQQYLRKKTEAQVKQQRKGTYQMTLDHFWKKQK